MSKIIFYKIWTLKKRTNLRNKDGIRPLHPPYYGPPTVYEGSHITVYGH